MIPCICIDDSNRPNDIPLSKWVKEGDTYHVIHATIVLPQGILGIKLNEIDLDANCIPYTFFSANRFAFDHKDMDSMKNMIMMSVVLDHIEEDVYEVTKIGHVS